ncbi:MAG TPA: hypothetical protein PK156_41105 [Polyangium sp.]|nr:hypothetical protein [Polyangium sp.]
MARRGLARASDVVKGFVETRAEAADQGVGLEVSSIQAPIDVSKRVGRRVENAGVLHDSSCRCGLSVVACQL